jgi:hypothetical protein
MKKQSSTKMKCALLALVVVAMAMPAMAQGSPIRTPSSGFCGQYTCVGQIASLYITSAGGTASQAQIYFSMNVSGIGCTLVSNLYFTIPPGTLGYNDMYSLLLQASASGEMFTVVATGSTCHVIYVALGAPVLPLDQLKKDSALGSPATRGSP